MTDDDSPPSPRWAMPCCDRAAMTTPIRPLSRLNPAELSGTWQVMATTLPFWHGQVAPSIEYQPLPDGRWRDLVHYQTAAGKPRTISGYDQPDPSHPGAFRWRGAGWLAWCTSQWCFVDVDLAAGLALTWFSAATLHVTPSGFDLYARDASVTPQALLAWLTQVEGRLGRQTAPAWFMPARGQGPERSLRP